MVLSAATHEKIRDEIKHYQQARGALLYALHLARAEAGALDAAIFDEVAEIFALRPIEVAEVASFYPIFNQPRAQAILSLHQPAVLPARSAQDRPGSRAPARHQGGHRDR